MVRCGGPPFGIRPIAHNRHVTISYGFFEPFDFLC